MTETARTLLTFVFAQARETLERSPEQVGSALGMSGRTVRRLENPDDEQRPRRATLQALAGFYGLDARFLTTLGEWDALAGRELAEHVAELAGADTEPPDPDDPEGAAALRGLVLRLARGAGVRAQPGETWQLPAGVPGAEDVPALVDMFVTLDRGRQRLAMQLLADLRRARDADRPADPAKV